MKETFHRRLSSWLIPAALLSILCALAVPAHATQVVCEPQSQGGVHPTEYWYDVTPAAGEQIRTFRVETEDQNPHDGSFWNFIQPPGWPEPTVGNGWVTWTCSSGANCPLPPGTHRFGFSNIHPKRWGSWMSDAPDSDANHGSEPDGSGRRVHIPRKFAVGEGDDEGGDKPDKPFYVTVVFVIADPAGMDLKDFFFTKDGEPLKPKPAPQHLPGGGAVSSFDLCLPEEPNDAHLVYAWADGAADTHHWIDPLVLPSWHRLYCARDQDLFVARAGDDPPVFCRQMPQKLPGGYECPDPHPPVEGWDYVVDGGEDPNFSWQVEPAADVDGDGSPDFVDSCPELPNPEQRDTDADGLGNVCDPEPFEDVDGLCPCDGPLMPTRVWIDHAEYEECVLAATQELMASGELDAAEADRIFSEASASTCGAP